MLLTIEIILVQTQTVKSTLVHISDLSAPCFFIITKRAVHKAPVHYMSQLTNAQREKNIIYVKRTEATFANAKFAL